MPIIVSISAIAGRRLALQRPSASFLDFGNNNNHNHHNNNNTNHNNSFKIICRLPVVTRRSNEGAITATNQQQSYVQTSPQSVTEDPVLGMTVTFRDALTINVPDDDLVLGDDMMHHHQQQTKTFYIR